jgi:hypothetical protein
VRFFLSAGMDSHFDPDLFVCWEEDGTSFLLEELIGKTIKVIELLSNGELVCEIDR